MTDTDVYMRFESDDDREHIVQTLRARLPEGQLIEEDEDVRLWLHQQTRTPRSSMPRLSRAACAMAPI